MAHRPSQELRPACRWRSEVRVFDFGPSAGSEAARRRPAVIVSNDAANAAVGIAGRGVVTVVPLPPNTDRVLPFELMQRLDDALRLHLDL